jgi:hypothetical protein
MIMRTGGFQHCYLPTEYDLFTIFNMELTQRFGRILKGLETRPRIFLNKFEYPIFTWDVFHGKKMITIILFIDK